MEKIFLIKERILAQHKKSRHEEMEADII